jgi:[acyl-carrier-protein] S-malonyltransferase
MTKVVAVAAGQGSQYVTMGDALRATHPAAQAVFAEASDLLGFDLGRLCAEGDEAELTETSNAQPAILTLAYAQAQAYFDDLGVYPVAYAGHSLGEYTALVLAGAVTFADAVRLVRRRGELMAAAGSVPSRMLAVRGVTPERAEAVCAEASAGDELVVVSNLNSSAQLVVSGHAAAVERAAELFARDGVRGARPLTVSAPFHSPYMQAAADAFRADLDGVTWSEPARPVVANCTARPYPDAAAVPDLLARQLTSPVRWTETMDYLESLQATAVVEVGPKAVLSGFFRRDKPNLRTFAFDRPDDVTAWSEYR